MKREDSASNVSSGEFTLADFGEQLRQMLRPGLLMKMLSHLPGMGSMSQILNDRAANAELTRMLGIIDSMTPLERHSATLIDCGRCDRIARGAGASAQDVELLLKQFEAMAPIMKSMADQNYFVCRAKPRR